MIRVTVWNENLHDRTLDIVKQIYPEGIHGAIAAFLGKRDDIIVRTATFEQPEHGLTEEVIKDTDVLIIWSHALNEEFSDEVAERVCEAVRGGMGLISLHSSHKSKIMMGLMGTSMTLKWMHDDRERLFVTAPAHPIADGLPECFELECEEMYGEFFDIPRPDDVVFMGWFESGYLFRSGCTFTRGYGKIFYFQPGHETCPTYHDENIQKVITNAVYYCAPAKRVDGPLECTPIHR